MLHINYHPFLQITHAVKTLEFCSYYLYFSLLFQSVYFLAEISPIAFNINLYMLNQTKNLCILLNFLNILVCIDLCIYVGGMFVEVKEQIVGISSLLPPCRSWNLI